MSSYLLSTYSGGLVFLGSSRVDSWVKEEVVNLIQFTFLEVSIITFFQKLILSLQRYICTSYFAYKILSNLIGPVLARREDSKRPTLNLYISKFYKRKNCFLHIWKGIAFLYPTVQKPNLILNYFGHSDHWSFRNLHWLYKLTLVPKTGPICIFFLLSRASNYLSNGCFGIFIGHHFHTKKTQKVLETVS